MDRSFKRVALLFWRALQLRCPNCGGGPIFESWLRMRDRCPRCGLAFLGILAATWPSPPWDVLLYGGVIMMVIAPFLFYPFSKTLFLAFDLVFRPPGPKDFL